MSTEGKFKTYTFGEGKTAIGQIVKFTCGQGDIDEVAGFLSAKVRSVDIHTTGRVSIKHGGQGKYTRYNIEQHKYAGGGPGECGGWGYIEVLEIKDTPNDRIGYIIHEDNSENGAQFTEWQTIDDAVNAFEQFYSSGNTSKEFPKQKGFLRIVNCGDLTPWFYAIGDQELIGDYAFPEGLQDDPVYTFGKKFLVFDEIGIPSVKTCMGTRLLRRVDSGDRYVEREYRVVYFDDGSSWDEGRYYLSFRSMSNNPPQPIGEDEFWIVEAVQQFKRLLAGKSTTFTINFTDGNKFVGKLAPSKENTSCAEGDYLLRVNIRGGKTMEGWARSFKPTKKTPNIIAHVNQKLAEEGKVAESIEILESKTKAKGKKWAGVFYNPSESVS